MTTTSPAATSASAQKLRIKLFADGANTESILKLAADPTISGFTTNPTLMRQSGVSDYRAFAHEILAKVTNKPISFEVFADEPDDMYTQAKEIASWGSNVYVKIPVTNTRRDSSAALVKRLTQEGVQLNVTAVFTVAQVAEIAEALKGGAPSVISVFAGRIADTGVDPVPHMIECVKVASSTPTAELLWASPREVLNLYQADAAGCHIITMTPDLLAKVALRNKDLDDYSEDTVKMFFNDAQRAGYGL
jgi:transaldolase